jgi:two-component sensor histidine kinase
VAQRCLNRTLPETNGTPAIARGNNGDIRALVPMEKILAILPERPQPALVRYGVSAIIILVCCLLQLGVHQYAGFTGFFLLLPGIFVCGLLFDRGSGFVATAIGTAFGWYLFTPSVEQPRAIVPLTLFFITGVATAFVSEGLRSTMERLAGAERAKDILLQELAHRTKNNIAGISSLLAIQARSSDDKVKAALEAAAGRVRVMADVHDYLLSSGAQRSVVMSRYLEGLCHKLGDTLRGLRPVAIKVAAESIELPEQKAVPIAIIVNELVTNSLKYAFPGDRAGTINVNLHMDGEIVLRVDDDGIGSGEATADGLGSRLMKLMTQQLGGTLTRDGNPGGCHVTVRIPK